MFGASDESGKVERSFSTVVTATFLAIEIQLGFLWSSTYGSSTIIRSSSNSDGGTCNIPPFFFPLRHSNVSCSLLSSLSSSSSSPSASDAATEEKSLKMKI